MHQRSLSNFVKLLSLLCSSGILTLHVYPLSSNDGVAPSIFRLPEAIDHEMTSRRDPGETKNQTLQLCENQIMLFLSKYTPPMLLDVAIRLSFFFKLLIRDTKAERVRGRLKHESTEDDAEERRAGEGGVDAGRAGASGTSGRGRGGLGVAGGGGQSGRGSGGGARGGDSGGDAVGGRGNDGGVDERGDGDAAGGSRRGRAGARRGARRGAGARARAAVLVDLDALPIARHVAVDVAAGRVLVGDLDVGDVHHVRSTLKGGLAAGPLNSAGRGRAAATAPVAKLQAHGGLGVVLAADRQGVVVAESADDVAVDDPLDALCVPVEGVSVEGGLRRRNADVLDTVVSSGVALAEEIGLHVRGVAADELPIDLVKIVGLEHDGRDDTLARRGLQLHIDTTEEEVEVGLDSRSLALLGNAELSTVGPVGDGRVSRSSERRVGRRALGEVCAEGRRVETRVSGASLLSWVAVREGLRHGDGKAGRNDGGSRRA